MWSLEYYTKFFFLVYAFRLNEYFVISKHNRGKKVYYQNKIIDHCFQFFIILILFYFHVVNTNKQRTHTHTVCIFSRTATTIKIWWIQKKKKTEKKKNSSHIDRCRLLFYLERILSIYVYVCTTGISTREKKIKLAKKKERKKTWGTNYHLDLPQFLPLKLVS